jgi:hypothetical protein
MGEGFFIDTWNDNVLMVDGSLHLEARTQSIIPMDSMKEEKNYGFLRRSVILAFVKATTY